MALQDGLAQLHEQTTTQSGTTITYTTVSGTTGAFESISGTLLTTGSIAARYFRAGTNTDGGLIVNFTTRNAVSGGDLVGASGANTIFAVGAFSTSPAPVIGIAVPASPVGSNVSCPVLVYGPYQLTASAAVTAGLYVHQGSGTNAIQGLGAGSSANFGSAMGTATSGGTVIVLVGK